MSLLIETGHTCRYELVNGAVAADVCTMAKAFAATTWDEEDWDELNYNLINDIYPESVSIVSAWVVGQVHGFSIPVKWEDSLDTTVSLNHAEFWTITPLIEVYELEL